MATPADASEGRVRPKPAQHVQVYGNDHSPWVQAVLLGLHEKGIPHTAVLLPPLSVFLDSGVLMPAAKLDDGPWLLDSERILVELGFSSVEPDDRSALQASFGSGALRRADDPFEFWRRFSLVRDGHPRLARRLWNQFWRAFSMLYFFSLITFARGSFPRPTAEQLVQEYSFFQDRFAAGREFLGGDAPDTVDLQLFGIVQMCASIPGPALEALRDEQKLAGMRDWIARMQQRFSDYAHLYTAPLFEPSLPEMQRAPAPERIAYWCGAALMWLALPITLPTALYLVRRVRQRGLQRP